MKNLLIILLLSGLLFNSCARRVVVTQSKSITVVRTLPRSYKVVRVNGKRYYYFNGHHYRKTRNGYVVVKV